MKRKLSIILAIILVSSLFSLIVSAAVTPQDAFGRTWNVEGGELKVDGGAFVYQADRGDYYWGNLAATRVGLTGNFDITLKFSMSSYNNTLALRFGADAPPDEDAEEPADDAGENYKFERVIQIIPHGEEETAVAINAFGDDNRPVGPEDPANFTFGAGISLNDEHSVTIQVRTSDGTETIAVLIDSAEYFSASFPAIMADLDVAQLYMLNYWEAGKPTDWSNNDVIVKITDFSLNMIEAAVEEPPVQEDNSVAAPSPVANNPPAVPTGDAGIIIFAGAMILTAAGVVLFRKQTSK